MLSVAASVPASASNLIQNSTFTSLTNGYGEYVVQSNGTDLTTGTYITQATSWNVAYNSAQTETTGGDSYPFLFVASPSEIDTTGEGFGDAKDNALRYIWGPNDGSSNGYTGTDPAGGNVLVMDGDYNSQAIYQTLSGLVVGHTYFPVGELGSRSMVAGQRAHHRRTHPHTRRSDLQHFDIQLVERGLQRLDDKQLELRLGRFIGHLQHAGEWRTERDAADRSGRQRVPGRARAVIGGTASDRHGLHRRAYPPRVVPTACDEAAGLTRRSTHPWKDRVAPQPGSGDDLPHGSRPSVM